MNDEIKFTILAEVEDLVTDLVYYNRKNDSEISVDRFNEAVRNGEITINEMVDEFRFHLENTFKDL